MKPLRNLKKIIFLLLLILYSAELAQAGEQITLSPDGGHSNQNQITEALKNGDVYLNAGVYEVDGPIFIGSNRVLSGDSNAIIKVWSGSSQWFTGSNSIISALGQVDNLEIYGFQIDGSCDKLPFEYHHSRADTAHDCERAIYVQGSTGRFNTNIKIHHMQISNCFSDGIHVRFANDVHCYSNFIQNCQHEGIFWVCVQNGLAEGNKIAGITSDCMRFDNCVSNIIQNNYLFSYTGNQNNQAPKGWHKGIQVADSGASMGYDGSNKPTHTTDIVVRWNTFANCGTQSIWLDSTGKGYDNVHIYDNTFLGVAAVTNDGHDFSLNITETTEGMQNYNDLTETIQPTLEMSEKVFSSIFDILDVEFTDTGLTNQTAEDIPLQVVDTEQGKIAGGVKIVGFKDKIAIDNILYIPDENAVLTQTRVIRNPDLTSWSGVIQKIDKKVNVKIENGTAYATLTVKTSWYTVKTNQVTGEKIKGNTKTSKATFTDTFYPVPKVLPRETTVKARVNVFDDTKNPITKVRLTHTNATQRIEYSYDENVTTHMFLIGERMTDETGLQYTAFSRCDAWYGTLGHMGNEIIIPGKFDPEKLHIKYYTPYESFEVNDIEIIYHKNDSESPFMATLKFLVQLIMAMYAGYKLMAIVIN